MNKQKPSRFENTDWGAVATEVADWTNPLLSSAGGPLEAVAMAGDGESITSGGADGAIRQWTLSAGRVIVADAAKVNDVAFSADGSQLVTGGDDKIAKLFKQDGTPIRQFAGSTAAITAVDFRSG